MCFLFVFNKKQQMTAASVIKSVRLGLILSSVPGSHSETASTYPDEDDLHRSTPNA